MASTFGDYLKTAEVKKLHLGAGKNIIQGWLNTDLAPAPGAFSLDLTKKFALPDAAFDYIFSEHVIEHLSFLSGQDMLQECHRVLKPNGKIRITTPNIQFLIDLYQDPKKPIHEKYVDWAVEKWSDWAPYSNPIFAVNNFFRNWGHKFIYDKDCLANSLLTNGFGQIIEHKILESDDVHLKNLENDTRMPFGFLQLESITLEAIKM